MQVSRRGFLWMGIAATVGANVTLDPITKLWVPVTPAIQTVASDEDMEQAIHQSQLATLFAKELGLLLKSSSIASLYDTEWKGPGRGQRLEVPELGGRGYFDPAGSRFVVTQPMSHTPRQAAYDMAPRLRRKDINLIAPITADLRPGVPFTRDVIVGLGKDEESGISARVLQFRTAEAGELLMYEVAAGEWSSSNVKTPSSKLRWRNGRGWSRS